jgi:hypothetical protein
MRDILTAVLGTLWLAAASVVLAGPTNREQSRQSYAQAERAMAAGNLPAAKVAYSNALVNARLAGDMPPGAEAALAEKLARVLGNLCERSEAEKIFTEAIVAAEKASGSESLRTFPLRIELAQFTFDTDQFEKATGYFATAFAVGEEVLSEKQPTAMAELVETYSIALQKSGRLGEAEAAREKAATLRAKGGSSSVVKSKSEYVPYPKTCQ